MLHGSVLNASKLDSLMSIGGGKKFTPQATFDAERSFFYLHPNGFEILSQNGK